jgi:hypothetical protein
MNSLRRLHKRRTRFWTETEIDVSSVADVDDFLSVLACQNKNLLIASHQGDNPDSVHIYSKGPIRNREYVPGSCPHYVKEVE